MLWRAVPPWPCAAEEPVECCAVQWAHAVGACCGRMLRAHAFMAAVSPGFNVAILCGRAEWQRGDMRSGYEGVRPRA